MKETVNLQKGRSLFTYNFWGNPELLDEMIEIVCRVKGLKNAEESTTQAKESLTHPSPESP